MNVGIAHSEENPNSSWLNYRGAWVSYLLGLLVAHLFFCSVPFLHGPIIWTLTNVTHNVVTYVAFHMLKGAPWLNTDQGRSRRLTCWEQIDYGAQFTDTKKFLTVVPVVLFMLCSYFTHYDFYHFLINGLTLLIVLVPKLPQFHKVRLFDINKY